MYDLSIPIQTIKFLYFCFKILEIKTLLKFSFVSELLLDLDVQAEEYLDDHKTPSILIYSHDPSFYPDFGSEAVRARAGHFYSVGMRKVHIHTQFTLFRRFDD